MRTAPSILSAGSEHRYVESVPRHSPFRPKEVHTSDSLAVVKGLVFRAAHFCLVVPALTKYFDTVDKFRAGAVDADASSFLADSKGALADGKED